MTNDDADYDFIDKAILAALTKMNDECLNDKEIVASTTSLNGNQDFWRWEDENSAFKLRPSSKYTGSILVLKLSSPFQFEGQGKPIPKLVHSSSKQVHNYIGEGGVDHLNLIQIKGRPAQNWQPRMMMQQDTVSPGMVHIPILNNKQPNMKTSLTCNQCEFSCLRKSRLSRHMQEYHRSKQSYSSKINDSKDIIILDSNTEPRHQYVPDLSSSRPPPPGPPGPTAHTPRSSPREMFSTDIPDYFLPLAIPQTIPQTPRPYYYNPGQEMFENKWLEENDSYFLFSSTTYQNRKFSL